MKFIPLAVLAVVFAFIFIGCSRKPTATARVQVVYSTHPTAERLQKVVAGVASVTAISGTNLFTFKASSESSSDAIARVNEAISSVKTYFGPRYFIIVDPPAAE